MLDEFAASSLLLLGLFMVDFYLTTAHRANFKDGLPTTVLVTCIALTYLNFVGTYCSSWLDGEVDDYL